MATEKLPFHLQGNFALLEGERTEMTLEVEGAIPPELRGMYVRNGANPYSCPRPVRTPTVTKDT